MRDQQQPRTRSAPAPAASRCRPTLYARFENEQLVELEHRHIARRPPANDNGGRYMTDAQRAHRELHPLTFDEGCRGPCVGRRDVLPLSYLFGEGAHRDQVPQRQPGV